jgi:hypothetical protein
MAISPTLERLVVRRMRRDFFCGVNYLLSGPKHLSSDGGNIAALLWRHYIHDHHSINQV